jgi:hypothetical protein
VGFYASPERIDMTSVGDLFGLSTETFALPGLIGRIFPTLSSHDVKR